MSPPATLLPATAIASDAQCAVAIERIGWIARQLTDIETREAAAVAAAKAAAETAATPLHNECAMLEGKVAAWCKAERKRLTRNNASKTAAFTSGLVHWRDPVFSVEFPAGVEKKIIKPLMTAIIAALKKLIGVFAPLVTVKISLSKTAIKAATKNDQALKAALRRRGIVFVEPTEELFSIVPARAKLADRASEAA